MTKICIFHPFQYNGKIGGTDIYVKHLINTLKESDQDVFVVCPGDIEIIETVDRVFVYRIPLLYPELYIEMEGLKQPDAIKIFHNLMNETLPDIIHFHCFGKWQLEYLKLARSLGIKTVITPHIASFTCGKTSMITAKNELCNGIVDVDICGVCTLRHKYVSEWIVESIDKLSKRVKPRKYFYKNFFLKRLLAFESVNNTKMMLKQVQKECDGIIVLNEWYRKILILNGIFDNKIKVIQTTGRNSDFVKYEIGNPLRLFFAGRQNREKGLLILLQALNEIPKGCMELHICGPVDTSSFSVVEKSIRELRRKGYTIIEYGLVSNESVENLMKRMHVLCYPSIDVEMCPLAIIEAQSMGIPVLGSNHSGIKDLIVDRRTGLLFQSNNVNSLSENMKSIINDPEILIDIHLNLRNQKKVNKKNSYSEHLKYYENIIAAN